MLGANPEMAGNFAEKRLISALFFELRPNNRSLFVLKLISSHNKPKMEVKKTENKNKKGNESQHSGFTLSAVLEDIKEHLGIIAVAEAGHGKSFAVASLVQQALKDENLTVIILSPSSIWKRKLWSGKYVKVGTADFNPIQEITKTEIESVPFLRDAVHINLDKKWSYVKNQWLEGLLESKESLLFEIKYRNGRRIKAFESVVIQAIYETQEKQIDANPSYNHHYIIVLEEIQNSFGTYSMNSDDSLDLMTIFSQSRSDALTHYIGIGQRLNDVSTKVIERLRPFIGLTLGENSLRKIKSQLPEELKDRVQQLPKRHWLYLDGKTNPEIEIPEFKRTNPPVQIKPPVEQQLTAKPKMGFLKALLITLTEGSESYIKRHPEIYSQQSKQPTEETLDDDLSDGDGLMTLEESDILLPPDNPEFFKKQVKEKST